MKFYFYLYSLVFSNVLFNSKKNSIFLRIKENKFCESFIRLKSSNTSASSKSLCLKTCFLTPGCPSALNTSCEGPKCLYCDNKANHRPHYPLKKNSRHKLSLDVSYFSFCCSKDPNCRLGF